MGRKCFITGCNAGSRSCREKVTLFNVPRDAKRRDAWAAAVPRKDRPLTDKDAICSRHFRESAIVRKRYFSELGGEVLLNVPKRCALADDAVPSIFPSTSALLHSAPAKRKRPLAEPSQRNTATKVAEAERDEATCEYGTSGEELYTASEKESAAEVCTASVLVDSATPPLCLEPSSALLPNAAWNHHTMLQDDRHSFCFMGKKT